MAIKIDLSKFDELLKIQQERQLAMQELSEILGYDVSFSDEEIIQNAIDSYEKLLAEQLNEEVSLLMKSLYS